MTKNLQIATTSNLALLIQTDIRYYHILFRWVKENKSAFAKINAETCYIRILPIKEGGIIFHYSTNPKTKKSILLLFQDALIKIHEIEALNEATGKPKSSIKDITDKYEKIIQNSELHQKLSHILVNALSENEISDELDIIYTVGYYARLTLLWILCQEYTIPLSFELLKTEVESHNNITKSRRKRILKKIHENKTLLNAIKIDVFKQSNIENINWLQELSDLLHRTIATCETITVKVYYELTETINSFLGLQGELGEMLNEFILYSFIADPDFLNDEKKTNEDPTLNNFSIWSIDNMLINALTANAKRSSTILELGSGEGTSALTSIFSVISLEHDPHYFLIRGKNHHTYFAPLKEGWYPTQTLKQCLEKYNPDLLLVDGPPTNNRPNLLKHVNLLVSFQGDLIFDDVNRKPDMDLCIAVCNKLKYTYEITIGPQKQFAWCKKKYK